MERNIYLPLMDPADARQLWLSRLGEAGFELGEESVPFNQSLGRVIAAPVQALRSSPAFHGAAMDGIAVRASQTFGAMPGRPIRLALGKEAWWVNTGRPLPHGTDAVVMVEDINVEDDGQTAALEKAAFPWQHVRKAGEDIVATEVLLGPGAKIGPYEIGAMAAAGVRSAPVFKKPKVAIIPSGNEIAPISEISDADWASGKCLPEFNSAIFSAMIEGAGGEAMVMPIAPDEPEAILRLIRQAIDQGADVVVLNAGASAGSHDFSAKVIKSAGELFVHGIAMMPGKPAALGAVHHNGRSTPIIGAPGYPVSAIMALEEFLLPLLAAWQKLSLPEPEIVKAAPVNPLPSRPGMEERIRVKLGLVDGQYRAVPLPRGAGTVTSLSRADAVIAVPKNKEGIGAGEFVDARLLRSRKQISGALLAIGSHDNTLDLLDSLLRRSHPDFRLTSAHVGSLGGLKALKAGQCHLAGNHLLDPSTGVYNRAAIKEHLPELPVALIRLVDRVQGLMLKPGNPLGISAFADLAKPDVRFVNRQRGSGTRALLDCELAKAGIAPASIRGYRDEEYTHMGVAVAVASGRADAGLGVAAAAKALGLDFIPLGTEEYDLVIPLKYMRDERIQALLEAIRSPEFKRAALDLGGYGVEKTGQIVWEHQPG